MKPVLIAAALAVAMWPSAVLSQEVRDLSIYPCTIFSGQFCFRLVPEAELTYSMPVDVAMYSVSMEGRRVLEVYDGGGWDEIDPKLMAASAEVAGWRVIDALSVDGRRRNFHLLRGSRLPSVVNIRVSTDVVDRKAVTEMLSGFRGCTPLKRGGVQCSVDGRLGALLVRRMSASTSND